MGPSGPPMAGPFKNPCPGRAHGGSFGHPPRRFKRPPAVPLLRGITMEVGCGARVREFHGGGRDFYFWPYEREGGRSVRKEDYVGRVDSEKARQDLMRRMAAYVARAEGELARRRGQIE